MENNNHLVIMAGGVGSRFWPLSTPEKPKQFIDILGTGRTMIQMTVDRFKGIIPTQNIWVVTSAKYKQFVEEQIPGIPTQQILLEPCMRNTAPCIAYVTWKIKQHNPDANLVVTPSDHLVTDVIEFQRIIRDSLAFTATQDNILTLGMLPTRPETGYGYIKQCEGDTSIVKVAAFKEKPDHATAEQYLAVGGYYWNSGIFIWNVNTIEKAFRTFEPEIAALFDHLSSSFYAEQEQADIDGMFPTCKSISIDYAIMERANNIYVLPASFGWSDLGTWRSLYEQLPKDENGNAVIGGYDGSIENCSNCLVYLPNGIFFNIQNQSKQIIIQRMSMLYINNL
ncbi:MAG: mannose-1-phosphate guanylyltransferase [Marinifilaceae bacterium]